MKVIHKYTVAGQIGEQFIPMQIGATILSAQSQGASIALWALVDTSERVVDRCIKVAWTGNPVDETGPHIGTVQIDGLVWHIFDGGIA